MFQRMTQGRLLVAAVLIVMLYVASIGPYAAISRQSRNRPYLPRWVTIGDTLFAPLMWFESHAPEPIDDVLREYCWFWHDLLIGDPP